MHKSQVVTMDFTKMHGAGNDYIYVDCLAQAPPDNPAELARQIAHRRFGVGADGLILIGGVQVMKGYLNAPAIELADRALSRRPDWRQLQAGIAARDAGSEQLAVVVERLLRDELETRGVEDADAVCQEAVRRLKSLKEDARMNSPQNVFQRMAGE